MPKSVTNAITIKLEKQRLMRTGTTVESSPGRDDYEKWAWDGCSAMSAAFLQSPPNRIRYMEDNVFQVAMTTYLGQPCPIITPLAGRCFGKKGAKVDKYGANLATTALPG